MGIVGCGLIGGKRAEALAPQRRAGRLLRHRPSSAAASARRPRTARRPARARGAARARAGRRGRRRQSTIALAELAEQALRGRRARARREAGRASATDADRAPDRGQRERAGRLVKVGFNHRFHPGIAARRRRGALGRARRAHAPARPLRPRRAPRLRARVARRPGALRRRRAGRPGHAPARPQPLARRARCRCTPRCCAPSSGTRRSRTTRRCCSATAASRTAPVGDAARELDRVEEHVLARDLLPHARSSRSTASCAPTDPAPAHLPDGPELGPPDLEEIAYPDEDVSWAARVASTSPRAIAGGRRAAVCSATCTTPATRGMQVEAAYAAGPYAAMRGIARGGGGRMSAAARRCSRRPGSARLPAFNDGRLRADRRARRRRPSSCYVWSAPRSTGRTSSRSCTRKQPRRISSTCGRGGRCSRALGAAPGRRYDRRPRLLDRLPARGPARAPTPTRR